MAKNWTTNQVIWPHWVPTSCLLLLLPSPRSKTKCTYLYGEKQAVWPDMAKFCHYGKTWQVFSKYLTVYFLFGKMLSLLWQIWYIIGLIFIVANCQILKNNITIWSHWEKLLLMHTAYFFKKTISRLDKKLCLLPRTKYDAGLRGCCEATATKTKSSSMRMLFRGRHYEAVNKKH